MTFRPPKSGAICAHCGKDFKSFDGLITCSLGCDAAYKRTQQKIAWDRQKARMAKKRSAK